VREHLFTLPDDASASLQSRLREMVVRAILDGNIPPGAALPSCRRLARQLGVARNTVVLAYQHLVDEGYLESRERSGYYVSADILEGRASAERPAHEGTLFAPDWGRRFKVLPSAQRNVAKRVDWQSYPYPFVYGQFDLALFPVADWRECARRALSIGGIRSWASDSIDRDDPMLVEQLRTRVLPRRGVWAAPDEILVTVGAQHALYLIAALLVDAGTTVGVEEPGYPDARNIFALHAGRTIGIGVDERGLEVNQTLADCDLVYTTPSHQYPTTATMSMARRQALLVAATDHDLLVVEDDYESEFNYVGEPTPALKSLDRNDRVLYVGSLSKTLAPGLRLGYLVGPAELVREARALRRLMLRHPPANNQRAVALFLALGHHDSLVRRLSHAFKERWQVLGEALARHLPESAQAPTFGGTAYWVRGPRGLDARALEARAAHEGILIEPGDGCFVDRPAPPNFFRLGFSSIPVDRIEPGIARLAKLARAGPRSGADG
jgi:GntR family transcriptional regulator/MocR family aminotransferase